MSFVVTIFSPYKTKAQKLRHYLFGCPTFWKIKPAFECPVCKATYRCYWDGNDIGGKINICKSCAHEYNRTGGW